MESCESRETTKQNGRKMNRPQEYLTLLYGNNTKANTWNKNKHKKSLHKTIQKEEMSKRDKE